MSRSSPGNAPVMSRPCPGHIPVMSRSCPIAIAIATRSCPGHVPVNRPQARFARASRAEVRSRPAQRGQWGERRESASERAARVVQSSPRGAQVPASAFPAGPPLDHQAHGLSQAKSSHLQVPPSRGAARAARARDDAPADDADEREPREEWHARLDIRVQLINPRDGARRLLNLGGRRAGERGGVAREHAWVLLDDARGLLLAKYLHERLVSAKDCRRRVEVRQNHLLVLPTGGQRLLAATVDLLEGAPDGHELDSVHDDSLNRQSGCAIRMISGGGRRPSSIRAHGARGRAASADGARNGGARYAARVAGTSSSQTAVLALDV
eukprot:CAMPEP_0119364704 /NCGR_PEP_ID=MMETSP1334-20130426/11624_1 /TAXON_ID=127549 /ORGANISM="Calcidiscus leptoporus, Strain RCC1130" /LENGTH=324 /DNA_ID=CAMNT_0007380479 /DNA_START=32 /DNA_END=1007 /DNA_ORIENTATION=+